MRSRRLWPKLCCRTRGRGGDWGAGIGLGYVCPIAACVKWFPDLKGLITGMAVAGFGGGAYLFIKLAGNWGGLLAAEGVSQTFLAYAAIFAVFVTLGASLLRNPPSGWQPAGWSPVAAEKRTTSEASSSAAMLPDFGQAETVAHARLLDVVAGVHARLELRADGDRLAEGFRHPRGAAFRFRSRRRAGPVGAVQCRGAHHLGLRCHSAWERGGPWC